MKTILVDAVDCFIIEESGAFHYDNDKMDLAALKSFIGENV